MVSRLQFTAMFETVEDGWIQARIKEIPGVITVGATLDAAIELLPDALNEYLLALGQLDEGELEGAVEERPLELSVEV
jgi:predicted RNase H-like HicB family nuclease